MDGFGYAVPAWVLAALYTDPDLDLNGFRRRIRGRRPELDHELRAMCVAAQRTTACGSFVAPPAEIVSTSRQDTVSTAQAAAALGVSARRIRQMIADGRLTATREGYSFRIQRGHVDELAAARRTD